MYFEEKVPLPVKYRPHAQDLNCEFVILGHSERRWYLAKPTN
jgi:triosephosphate isomerase